MAVSPMGCDVCDDAQVMGVLHAEQPALWQAVRDALRAYERGAETAREVDERLAALVVHMETCFADEEACMNASFHPQRGVHAAQHRRALWEAREAMRCWLSDRNADVLGKYLHQRLPQWRIRHRDLLDRPCGAALSCRDSHTSGIELSAARPACT